VSGETTCDDACDSPTSRFSFAGDMFACEQCNEWSHLNCYVEFKDFSNEELDLAKIYCRRCQPSESPLFNLATKTIARILELGDFGTRKQCVLVCKSLWSMARGAESSLKIRHVSPDVAFHLLEQSPNLRALTLYCWHTKLARAVNVALRELTIVSAAPAPSLGALPRNIEELRVYDAAVTDSGVMAALGRSGRGMGSLRVLDLAGSSVTASISPQLFPASLTTLILCATPTNDAGMMLNVCRPDDSGTQFPNLRHLDLSHTLVTGAILRHIPRKLHVLNLAFTGVTMEGLRSMLGLPRLQLKTLFLMGVRDVDKAALSELAPKVTIIL
jgi:hypothetical protein